MLRINCVEWRLHQAALRAVREAVFVHEQGVPLELEWDGLDPACSHVLAVQDDIPVGTARMTREGKIGRMAVLKAWRRQGVGSQLLTALIDRGRAAGLEQLVLEAQLHAMPFYHGFGFSSVSATFLDAGIEHQTMVLRLD